MDDTMKLSDLRPCDNCDGILRGGIFYVLTARIAVINAAEANQSLALMRQLGSLDLAEVMGATPDPVKLVPAPDATKVYLCTDCYCERLGRAIEQSVTVEATKDRARVLRTRPAATTADEV